MPISGNPPAPATSIAGNAYYASGGSGIIGASGEASGASGGDSSGPWLVETQSLHFEYVRVPNAHYNSASGYNLDLDSGGPLYYDIKDTKLQIRGTARYRRRITYDQYSSRKFTQTQKFEVLAASADYKGESYGTVSGGQLGPAGEVRTRRKWYARRPYVSSIDTEVNRRIEFFSVLMGSSLPKEVGDLFGQYESWFENDEIIWGTHNPDDDSWRKRQVQGHTQVGYHPGAYVASQDSAIDVPYLIDQIGEGIEIGTMWWPRKPTSETDYVSMSEYSIERHDYTED